jgi:hypothetical protein
MADDNNKGLVKPHKNKALGATPDSSGYFSKKIRDIRDMQENISGNIIAANSRGGIIDALENKERSKALAKLEGPLKEAEENYSRQRLKGERPSISKIMAINPVVKSIENTPEMFLKYDKNGRPINPFSSKKEIKPAAIVAPVKRPSEAVMKKVTGK